MDKKQNINDLFKKVQDLKVEQPYLHTRVLASLHQTQQLEKSILVWKLLFGLSLTFSMALISWNYIFNDKYITKAATDTSYVIHLNFDDHDKQSVANAEIELPDDVYFIKANNEKLADRKLKLPVSIKEIGRGKLPFVLTSNSVGAKTILVNLLDENNNLVKKQILKLKFAKNESNLNSRKD